MNPESRRILEDLQRDAGVLTESNEPLHGDHSMPFDDDPSWVNEAEDETPPPVQVEIVHALHDLRIRL